MVNTSHLSTTLHDTMSTLRITPSELADAVGASDRTLARWLANETYPQHDSRRKLTELETLVHHLCASFTSPEDIADWLHANSGYLGGLRPIDALRCGRIDAVEAALESILAGIFV